MEDAPLVRAHCGSRCYLWLLQSTNRTTQNQVSIGSHLLLFLEVYEISALIDVPSTHYCYSGAAALQRVLWG